ncbi:hypothetical protein, partial [Ochrobactrum sp. SFR4]|uniref:hypothetical protein n=1 Tax=Ochrobactrum sp. SFR4 TaxID=2717368 RepID=UPI001C8CDBBF
MGTGFPSETAAKEINRAFLTARFELKRSVHCSIELRFRSSYMHKDFNTDRLGLNISPDPVKILT